MSATIIPTVRSWHARALNPLRRRYWRYRIRSARADLAHIRLVMACLHGSAAPFDISYAEFCRLQITVHEQCIQQWERLIAAHT